MDFRFRTTMVEEARVRRHAVRCQMKLEMALMERQEMLRKTLRELKVSQEPYSPQILIGIEYLKISISAVS